MNLTSSTEVKLLIAAVILGLVHLVWASVAETAKTWAEQERQRILDALRASGGRVYGPGGAAHRLGLNPTTLYGNTATVTAPSSVTDAT